MVPTTERGRREGRGSRAELEPGIARWPAHFAQRYRDLGLWSDDTVAGLLSRSAARHPAGIAAAGRDWRLSYAELAEASARFGAALLELGLRNGDRVLFQLANAPETIVAYYGAIRAGLVPVCAIAQHGEYDMRRLAVQTRARAHIVQGDFRGQDLVALAGRVAAASEQLEFTLVTRGGAGHDHELEAMVDAVAAAEATERLAEVEILGDDVAVFQLSGGTTGAPKVIPRIHCDYIANARLWADACGWSAETRVMHIPPLLHNAGISASMQPCHWVGGQLTLPETTDVGEILALIEREQVQVLPLLPPAMLIRLIEYPRIGDHDLGSLRQYFVGGQRLAPEIAAKAEEVLGIPCNQKFGMAEGMFFRTPDEGPAWGRHNTVGAPISSEDEVRILQTGTEDPVEAGAVGELCCRGPYTIRGYFEAEEHNAVAFTSDGFYRTGDLAREHLLAGRRYYSIEGRIKDVINRGAEKISATEVEELVRTHPAVADVAVVAMPDRELGERSCAYVVTTAGATLTLPDLVEFLLAAGLAKFKLPERLEPIDVLPLTSVGKLDKRTLRERIATQIEAEAGSAQAAGAVRK